MKEVDDGDDVNDGNDDNNNNDNNNNDNNQPQKCLNCDKLMVDVKNLRKSMEIKKKKVHEISNQLLILKKKNYNLNLKRNMLIKIEQGLDSCNPILKELLDYMQNYTCLNGIKEFAYISDIIHLQSIHQIIQQLNLFQKFIRITNNICTLILIKDINSTNKTLKFVNEYIKKELEKKELEQKKDDNDDVGNDDGMDVDIYDKKEEISNIAKSQKLLSSKIDFWLHEQQYISYWGGHYVIASPITSFLCSQSGLNSVYVMFGDLLFLKLKTSINNFAINVNKGFIIKRSKNINVEIFFYDKNKEIKVTNGGDSNDGVIISYGRLKSINIIKGKKKSYNVVDKWFLLVIGWMDDAIYHLSTTPD